MAVTLTKDDRELIESSSSVPEGKALEVKNLVISFRTDNGKVQAVRGVSFDLYKGETLCIVGESGSGKSVTSKAIMGILSPNAIVEGGQILYRGIDLTKASETEYQTIRGRKIGMIFQDPLSSLNPIVKIGKQITETMLINSDMLKRYYEDLISPELTAYMNAKSLRNNTILEAKNKATLPLNGYEDTLSSFAEKKSEIGKEILAQKKQGKDVSSLKQQLVAVKEEEKAYKAKNKDYLKQERANAKEAIAAAKKEYASVAPELKKKLSESKKSASLKTKERKASLKEDRDAKLKVIAEEEKKLSLTPEQSALVKELSHKILFAKIKGKVFATLLSILPKKHMAVLKKMEDTIAPLQQQKNEILKDFIALEEKKYAVIREYQSQTKITKAMAKEKALKVMQEVGIPQPEKRFKQYPFQFSGGMRQRIVIAIALISEPDVLICDEPTTALDVTIQAQILELINRLKKAHNMSVIFITHDLGVVANMADRVAVMYAGKICEYGTDKEIFFDPRHPYTWALLASVPDIDSKEKLEAIPGTPPDMIYPPQGDAFALRNRFALGVDFKYEPPFFQISPTHYVASWLEYESAPSVEPPKIVSERIHHALKEEEALINGK